jgi:hypothetical protein
MQTDRHTEGRTERQTDMTKLIVAFRYYGHASENTGNFWCVLPQSFLGIYDLVGNKYIMKLIQIKRRSQWPLGLRRGYTAARLLRSWVQIPSVAWMFVCCVCCVSSGRGVCDELSLVRRSPTDCGASLCAIKKLRERRSHSPRWAAEPEKIINNTDKVRWSTYRKMEEQFHVTISMLQYHAFVLSEYSGRVFSIPQHLT